MAPPAAAEVNIAAPKISEVWRPTLLAPMPVSPAISVASTGTVTRLITPAVWVKSMPASGTATARADWRGMVVIARRWSREPVRSILRIAGPTGLRWCLSSAHP